MSASRCSAVVTSPSEDMPVSADGSICLRSPVAGLYTTTILSLDALSTIEPSGIICTLPSTIYTCWSLPSLSFSLSVAVRKEPSVLCCICSVRSLSTAAIISASSSIRCMTPSQAACNIVSSGDRRRPVAISMRASKFASYPAEYFALAASSSALSLTPEGLPAALSCTF